ncbi:MAG: tRNA threonylcarbamoyladenosine dehydratase [Bacteroidales bacterium]|jgi:tRNA A37 threonylcarbamoyladenosine dehydratase|nr:tRNA threonylcarbamoyladenosine dehydratase [Bacteroidales bacterium]
MIAEQFQRSEMVLGSAAMERMRTMRVIIFGIGGVGSWCAESLVRSGFYNLTLVDYDEVCASNINRQAPALHSTLGMKKTTALAARLRDINPDAEIMERCETFTPENSDSFELNTYDVIIDAIDSVHNKIHLIREACKTDAFFMSSMGAARKMEASMVAVAPFWKVKNCLFARRLRKLMRKTGVPQRDFLCVYSMEQNDEAHELQIVDNAQKRVNGSLMHITAIFGLYIAGEVLKQLRVKN